MASITKRKGGWCVQVRRKGYEARNNTFPTKSAALKWGREQEALMDGGRLPATTAPLRAKRLADLIEQYRLTVSPHKRSSETECLRLGRMAKDAIAAKVLIDLTSAYFAAYRDRRLKLVKPGTVRRELYLFANMIDTATKEWGYQSMKEMMEANIGLRQCRLEGWNVSHTDGWQTAFTDIAARQPIATEGALQADYQLPLGKLNAAVGGTIKVPTASREAALGTGEVDFGINGQISQRFGNVIPFVTAGYTFIGEPTGFDVRNTLSGAVGGQFVVRKSSSVTLSYSYDQAATNQIGDNQSLGLGFATSLTNRLQLGVDARAGVSADAPDARLGIRLGVGF